MKSKIPGGLLVSTYLDLPFRVASFIAECLVSPRGIGCGILLAAAGLSFGGWLRPPLSPDIRGTRISLGILSGSQPEVEILNGRGQTAIDSPAVLFSLVIMPSIVLILWRPGLIGKVAGVLLVLAVTANAAVVLNHPGLTELMEQELVQRQNMVTVLTAMYPTVLSDSANGRVGASMADLESFDMPTDFAYLSFSKWLIVLMLATSLYASDATGSRRVAKTLGWLAVGIVLAIITCFPRLIAEYELLIAREAEQQGDFAYSRQMVESAGRACPGLANLHSVWLLIGSLDEKQGRSTVASQLWTAEKWSQNGDLPRSLAIVLGPASDSEGETSGVAKWLAGMYLTRAGLTHFSARRPASAADAWRRALSFDPERRDCALFLGIAQSQMDRERSDLVEIEFQPLMTRMSDGALRADVLNLLGDAHFLAGNVDAARDCYQKSYELFNLPKIINYRAIKGLGGF